MTEFDRASVLNLSDMPVAEPPEAGTWLPAVASLICEVADI